MYGNIHKGNPHEEKEGQVKIIKKNLYIINTENKIYSYVELGGCPGYITDAITENLIFKEI
jgi:hypothetical protein